MKSLLWEELNITSQNNHGKDGADIAHDSLLTKNELTAWEKLVKTGLDNALSGLSDLLGHDLKLNTLNIIEIPIDTILELLHTNDDHSIGTYLSVEGDIPGQVMLVHTPEIAYQLIDLLLDLPPGSTNEVGNIERCALEDIGNITGSYFLNTMADNAGLFLMPSPPEVLIDSLENIMKIPVEFIRKQQQHAILVESTFSADHQQMDGTFIALPTIDFIKAVTSNMVEDY